MDLDALGNIGDFVGGLAVVVTLIYLAYQIRQNGRHVEQALEVSRAQAVRETLINDWTLEVARDPDLARLYSRGLRDPEQLAENDLVRFLFLMGTAFATVEKCLLMHQRGLLTDERWNAQLRTLGMFLAQPGGTYYWKRFSSMHTSAFASVVEQVAPGIEASLPAA